MLYTRPKQTSHVEKKICKALNQTANLSCQQTSQRLFSAPWFTMDGNEQRGKNEAYKPGAFRALFLQKTKDLVGTVRTLWRNEVSFGIFSASIVLCGQSR